MANLSASAGRIGLGLAAGLIGTLVMTLGQKAEIALTDRPPSKVPAQAVEKITDTEVAESREQQLSTAVHFAYGTALGVGLAAMDEVPEPARTALYFAAAWGAGMALLQGLKLEGRPSEWDLSSAAIDGGHHVVYALAAGLAYDGGRRLFAATD